MYTHLSFLKREVRNLKAIEFESEIQKIYHAVWNIYMEWSASIRFTFQIEEPTYPCKLMIFSPLLMPI